MRENRFLELVLILLFISTQKMVNAQEAPNLKSKPSGLSITINEIMDKLPMTILHNMGDNFQLRLNEAQWSETDTSLSARIPTTVAGDRFLYAVKSAGGLKIYLQINYNESGDYDLGTYAGTMELLDLETMTVYGLKYQDNVAVEHLTPTRLLDSDVDNWECKAKTGGFLYMGDDGKIYGKDTSTLNLAQIAQNGCWNSSKGAVWSGFRKFYENLGAIFVEVSGSNPNNQHPSPSPVFPGSNGQLKTDENKQGASLEEALGTQSQKR